MNSLNVPWLPFWCHGSALLSSLCHGSALLSSLCHGSLSCATAPCSVPRLHSLLCALASFLCHGSLSGATAPIPVPSQSAIAAIILMNRAKSSLYWFYTDIFGLSRGCRGQGPVPRVPTFWNFSRSGILLIIFNNAVNNLNPEIGICMCRCFWTFLQVPGPGPGTDGADFLKFLVVRHIVDHIQ